ncbi:MAG TPA: N-acetylneuraminate synthase family protein [Spirochaetota bacterium]|nr:N-acetylneuraminate synthase family protein [Spirochaetota bacterium]HPC41219.1 N-acetylneuraminate synthase family protein [Spirochaetota bacterium]HPL17494.1 N-acetylneuraminate synthase family protein [Spirochaetota bacterium]HQF08169.1 N-acetylneuraminate synthase family protein [Spirochaetota bacterium]HQH96944.1 N-acetylneuraminate synthase family protein [Spirochaetota bacterium]
MLDAIIQNRRNAIYIAEIGLNHNGNPDVAMRMIQAAARAGADAVKFQTFVPELMSSVYTKDLMDSGVERQRDSGLVDFFKTFVFDGEQYRALQKAAAAEGLIFFTSVFDTESLEMMEGLDLPLYKLASSEVTNHPLIRAVAVTGKPLILSTGMSSEEEIDAAVDLYRKAGGTELVLLHCVSLYPTPADQVNLARIPALAKRFGLPVGFSDHTREATAPMLAAAVGARIFEKHFTIDRFHECPDKDISCTPEEFAGIIDSVERAVVMTGSGAVAFGREEAGTARGARRSLFARRLIPAGKAIDGDDLVALRPGVGIPPSDLALVVGKRSRVDIPADHLIRKEHLAGS